MNRVRNALYSIDLYDFIIILLITTALISLITALCIFLREKNKNTVLYQRKRKNFLIKSFHVFSQFNLTKRYVEQIRKRYEMLCPEDQSSLKSKTMCLCYVVWGVSAAVLAFIFGLKPSLYTAGISFFSIAVFNREFIEFRLQNMENALLSQLDKFLSDTRHSFYQHGMIDEAISDASELSGRIMKVNSDKIQSVLESNDKENAIRIYNQTVSNRFLRMFLSVAVYVSEFGDKLINGVSIFLLNIHSLKNDIYIEQMNRKETSYKFSGLIFTVITPLYLLNLIKNWSISTSPELERFYNGTAGFSLVILIFAATVIMYLMIHELKDNHAIYHTEHLLITRLSFIKPIRKILDNYEDKNRRKLEKTEDLLFRVQEKLSAKQFLLKRMLYGLVIFILCMMASAVLHDKNRDILTTSSKLIRSEDTIPDKYVTTAGETVLRYTKKYVGEKYEKERIDRELRTEGIFRSDTILAGVAEEIKYRLERYRQEYFQWYELLVAVVLAGVGYWSPYGMLLYRKKIMNLNMGNEVSLFQSTIMLVMHHGDTTVLKVLELMESFADIFKDAIKTCINDYSSGDLDALDKLKMRERYEPFRRLIDNLIIADRIGIQRAFDEVAEERKVSQEMRNQDYRISRDKKVIYGTVMAFFPAFLTIALYWIIPFAANALSHLSDYDAVMSNLR